MKILEPTRIIIGRLGELSFESGYYICIGSTINGLRARLNRHKINKCKSFGDLLLKYLKKMSVLLQTI